MPRIPQSARALVLRASTHTIFNPSSQSDANPTPVITNTSTSTVSNAPSVTTNDVIVQTLLERMDVEDEEDDEEADTHWDDNGIDAVYESNIVDAARSGYHNGNRRLAVWIYKQYITTDEDIYRQLLHDDQFTAIENNVSKNNIKSIIARASQTYHPINLHLLTVDHFINFLLSLKTPGEYLSKSGYGGIRSSLFDLFRETKIKPSEDFKADLARSFSGLKRLSQRHKECISLTLILSFLLTMYLYFFIHLFCVRPNRVVALVKGKNRFLSFYTGLFVNGWFKMDQKILCLHGPFWR